MFGTLFKFEIESTNRQAFIDFIDSDIRFAEMHEPGTLRFDMYEDARDPNTFFMYEAYADEKAFEQHKQHDPYRRRESHIRPEMVMKFREFFKGGAVLFRYADGNELLQMVKECTDLNLAGRDSSPYGYDRPNKIQELLSA